MEELIFLLFLIGIPIIWRVRRILSKQAEARRREGWDAERNEDRRLSGCEGVIHFFANHMGYLAREMISRSELAHLIEDGISPG